MSTNLKFYVFFSPNTVLLTYSTGKTNYTLE